MGVFGAAIATGISQLVGSIVPIIFFVNKNNTKLRLIKTKIELKPILSTCLNRVIRNGNKYFYISCKYVV